MSKKRSKARRPPSLVIYESFAEADAAERDYWRRQTAAARMRALERLRQLNYGYGPGKPLPRFQRILKVAKLGNDDDVES